MSGELLIIDDEDDFRNDLSKILEQEGYTCYTAGDAEEGLSEAKEIRPDVIFLDIVMPGRSGTDVLDELQAACPEAAILMITAHGDEDAAVDSFRKGITDYLPKPLDFDEVIEKLERIMERKRSMQKIRMMRRRVNRSPDENKLIGKSQPMNEIREEIKQVAKAQSTILITGESGTGKELAARSIHNRSPNAEEPFLPLNCAGIPEQLLESELFGHKKGAFTGAVEDKSGFCDAAGDGTLLLDEIAEMPMNLQSKLLRVLDQEEFRPVGATETKPLNARIIASTNRDLTKRIEEGSFREDLYYRIAVYEITLPPLRDRKDDIPLLVDHFVNELNIKMNINCPGPTDETLDLLITHDWPGNVRELKNVVERCLIICGDERITPDCLPGDLQPDRAPSQSPDQLEEAMNMYERQHIRRVLEGCDGNKSEAAETLGIGRTTLYRKMKKLGIAPEDETEEVD